MDRNKLVFALSRALMIIFIALGVVFSVLVALKGTDELRGNSSSVLDIFFNITYVIIILGVALAVIFPIFGFISDYKKGLRALISLLLLVGLFGISYVFASDGIEGVVYEKMGVTPGQSKLVEGGIIMTYILALIAVVTVAVTSVTGLFKR